MLNGDTQVCNINILSVHVRGYVLMNLLHEIHQRFCFERVMCDFSNLIYDLSIYLVAVHVC